MVSIVEWCESNWGFSPPSYVDSWHFRLPLFWITMWTIGEVVAAKIYKDVRQSCKKISLLHCIVAFALSSVWLAYHFVKSGFSFKDYVLTSYEFPGTFEHHILNISMSYFVVDLPFAIAFHRTFIVHHLLCIAAFMAIQGYLRYWPFEMDFMAWETSPSVAPSHLKQYMLDWFGQDPLESDKQMQLLMGGFNGVFNLWMAELGGLFFHINRAFQGTEWEMPSRGLFVLMFTFSRCYLWPMYIRYLYEEAARTRTAFHFIGGGLETGLFLTNLHFLWKNLKPILKTGRLMPKKPRYYHREWLEKHPSMFRAASFFVPKDKIDLKRRASYQSSKDLSMEEELLSAGSKGSVRSRSNGTKKSN
mmetsp:Transcript_626/g.2486  ORF Transcript_626/g.2486 Transcript_626/m.2486 type:complete len:360 (-) Transcript_626:2095-3174(-)